LLPVSGCGVRKARVGPKKKEIMMKITSLIGLWLCIVVIGLAPLAEATPFESKDLQDLKLELKGLKQELKDLQQEHKTEGKEFKTENNGIKDLKLEIKDLKQEIKDLKRELRIEAKHHGWKPEGYTGQKGYEGFSTIQRSDVAQSTLVQPIPEPETLLLLGLGFVALTLWYRLSFAR